MDEIWQSRNPDNRGSGTVLSSLIPYHPRSQYPHTCNDRDVFKCMRAGTLRQPTHSSSSHANMAYAYHAQGRRMPWFEWFSLMKNKGSIASLPLYNLYMLYPPETSGGILPNVSISEVYKKAELAHELFDKRPDLFRRYGYVVLAPSHYANQQNPLYRFILRQYYWMQKGFTKSTAFDKAESEFANVFLFEQRHSNALREVANYSSAVSYFNYYQEVAEYEGRLKTQRLLADLEKHTRLKNYVSVDESLPEAVKKWERLKARYYSQEYLSPKPMTIQEIKTRFSTHAEKLIQAYEIKANVTDGLLALHNEQILWDAKDVPKDLTKHFKNLHKEMKDLGVSLDANGNVDTSMLKNPELAQIIQSTPLLKTILSTKGHLPSVESERTAPPPLEKNSQPVDTTDQDLTKRRAHLRELWSMANSKKHDPAEQFNIQTKAVKALRKVRKQMDLKLMKSGQEPLFPPAAAAYEDGQYQLDESLDMNQLTELMKKSSENPVLLEQERFEMEEVEALAKPVNVIERSVPVTTDENQSSMLHDHIPDFFSSSLAEITEESDPWHTPDLIDPLVKFDLPDSPKEKRATHFDDHWHSRRSDSVDAEDLTSEDIFYGDDSESNAPSTRKENIKFDKKKKGKLSSAISKLGRKK